MVKYLKEILIVSIILVATSSIALGISLSVGSGDGDGSSHIDESFQLDDSAKLVESIEIGEAIVQDRTIDARGQNVIEQSQSGGHMGRAYAAEVQLESNGLLSIRSRSQTAPQGSQMAQDVDASGQGIIYMAAASGEDEVIQESGFDDGIMSSQSTLIAGMDGVATTASTSIRGSGHLGLKTKVASASSQKGIFSTDNGGDAQESLDGWIYAGANGATLSIWEMKASGDKVTLSTKSSNVYGSYSSYDEGTDLTAQASNSHSTYLTEDELVSTWIRSGFGRMETISDRWTSNDGARSVSNRVSGDGYPYDISGSARSSDDSVALAQHLDNTQGRLSTTQIAQAENNGETLTSSTTTSWDGTITGDQWAGANSDKVYTSQSLAGDGTVMVTNQAVIGIDPISSSAQIQASHADDLSLESVAIARNSLAGDDLYHRTYLTLSVSGWADRLFGASSAQYELGSAQAQGIWRLPGYGSLSLGAETVRSAVVDVELETDSRSVEVSSKSGNSEIESGLLARAEGIRGGIDKFQAHLYSHAYPINEHHGQDEYVTTASAGTSGMRASESLYRWNDEAQCWSEIASYSVSRDESMVIRANDIETTTSDWQRLWEVPARSQTPTESVPWGIKFMYGDSTLTRTSGGEGVDVTIIDTGVDALHPDLVMRLEDFSDRYGPGEYDRCDYHGHGTHVAGTILADGGFDGQGIWGMAPDADLHVYSTNLEDYDMARAIYRSTDLGTEIISMSLGGSEVGEVLAESVRYALDNGVMVVAAAGNGLPSNPTIAYPSAFEGVVSVGALDIDGSAIWWTSPGFNDGDGVMEEGEVYFGAPGVGITSTYPTYKSSSYAVMSGTSMATPHISGAVAVVWSRYMIMGYGSEDVIGLMQGYARENDVTTVHITTSAKGYKPLAEAAQATFNGTPPGDYYEAIIPYMDGKEYWLELPLMEGEDCLTGMGVPRLPSV